MVWHHYVFSWGYTIIHIETLRYVKDAKNNVFFKNQKDAYSFMASYGLSHTSFHVTKTYIRSVKGKRIRNFTRLPKERF